MTLDQIRACLSRSARGCALGLITNLGPICSLVWKNLPYIIEKVVFCGIRCYRAFFNFLNVQSLAFESLLLTCMLVGELSLMNFLWVIFSGRRQFGRPCLLTHVVAKTRMIIIWCEAFDYVRLQLLRSVERFGALLTLIRSLLKSNLIKSYLSCSCLRSWSILFPLVAKRHPQYWHSKGFSPVCVRRWCRKLVL